MSILDELTRLSAAEEFFGVLDVPYDPAVVNVARLHILRRMGQYLRQTDFSALSEGEIRETCRETLERAYGDFLRSSPIAERVFKVHQDAVRPAEPPAPAFVPLASITLANG